jgi:alpha-methylacyl-CoA racemase
MDQKKILKVDFKKDLEKLKSIVLKSDVLLDPYRPGVLEAIGLDPLELMKQNKGLIIARITGYGQTGPYSQVAGHDINYVGLSGEL